MVDQSKSKDAKHRSLIWTFVMPLLFAIFFMTFFPGDISIKFSDQTVKLGDLSYDVKILDAPVATGMKLRVLSNILSSGPLAPALRRLLLNNNNMHKLRELNAQIESSKYTPLTHPVNRHPAEDILSASHKQAQSDKSLLEDFTTNISDNAEATAFSLKYPRRTIRSYHERYKSLKNKPSEILRKTLDQIKQWENIYKLNIFSTILPEQVLQAAQESDLRFAAGKPLSILDGVPIAIKDMIHIKGHLLYNGKSPKPEYAAGHVLPEADDIMVHRLRSAGAIILGSTIMTEVSNF